MSADAEIRRVQQEIRDREWAITDEVELGFRDLRHVIVESFYAESRMAADRGGPVQDRWRAKDYCAYRWDDDVVTLEPAPDGPGRIGCGDRARDVPRLDFLGAPGCAQMVRAQIELVPPERRRPAGTWGVHTFRSFSNVVDGPHKDDFEYGLIHVLGLIGGGAESYLLENDRQTEVMRHQLQPGEIFMFKDSEFFHGATPLEGNPRQRDALVIQIDAPEDLESARLAGLL